MKEYLLNYANIIQDFPDISDYECFFYHCKNYIQKNPSIHASMLPIFLISLENLQNETLISITYRLLNLININFEIKKKILEEHFKSDFLKNEIFMYIANNKVTEFKDKVINCLYDKNYKSNGLNTALVSLNYETEIIDFLEIKDFDLIEKQIDVMIGTNNFHNLEYFIPLIGCKYKNICFYTSELINKLFVSNFENEFIECIAKKYLIFKKVFKVQSFENFIFYFYDYFEEKEILLKSIELNDNKKFLKFSKNLSNVIKMSKFILIKGKYLF